MKFKPLFLIIVTLLITGCFGPFTKPDKGIDQDYLNKQKQAEKAKTEISSNSKLIDKKGVTLIHGADYALNLETNKTPPVQVASELVSHAKLTLGNPSLADAKKIEDIVDGLIQEIKAENLKLKLQSVTNKIEIDVLKVELQKAEKEGKVARDKLNAFEGEIVKLQNNEDLLKKKYQGELDKLQKENEENAAKANAWEEENSLVNSLNPFHDLMKFIKKLFTLSVVCGVLFIGFKVLEVFVPSLSLVSGVFSMIIGIIKKIAPAALKMAGCVSTKVYDTLAQVVQSNQSFMKTLKEMPIEDDLIKGYPDDYKFDKKEVKELLLALTDKTLTELQKELDKNLNDETRGVVTYVKAASGVKAEKPVTSLI